MLQIIAIVIGIVAVAGYSCKALSTNREVDRFADQELRTLPVKANAHIYKGALVGIDADTGCARGLVAGDAFAGIAYEEMHNTGLDAAKSVRVFTRGDFVHALAGAANANNGARVYASADNTLSLTPTGNSLVGRQVSVPSAGMIVLRLATVFESAPFPQAAAQAESVDTVTYTEPGSPDYALQDLTNSGGYGFATKDEGNSLIAAVANAQARLATLETACKAAGIVA